MGFLYFYLARELAVVVFTKLWATVLPRSAITTFVSIFRGA